MPAPGLTEGRIEMTAVEEAGVEKVLAEHGAAGGCGLSRNDPGETGVIRVDTPDGVWLVDENGKAKKAAG